MGLSGHFHKTIKPKLQHPSELWTLSYSSMPLLVIYSFTNWYSKIKGVLCSFFLCVSAALHIQLPQTVKSEDTVFAHGIILVLTEKPYPVRYNPCWCFFLQLSYFSKCGLLSIELKMILPQLSNLILLWVLPLAIKSLFLPNFSPRSPSSQSMQCNPGSYRCMLQWH